MRSMWDELKRRNVVRVAVGYLILAWLLLQVADVILGNIGAPGWVFQVILLLLALGFPMALFFAWAFELTPEGIKKEKDVDRSQSIARVTGRKLDFVIIALLVMGVVYLGIDKFTVAPEVAENEVTESAEQPAPVPEDGGPSPTSIAVLPFVNMSADPDNEYFADGISEEILNLLANIPELQVTSRSSAFSFKGQNLDVPTMAASLNVAHVLEGSVRKSGDQLRITAQLIRVETDTHLWSETYDRELRNVFEIQDEIAETVAAAMEVALLGHKPRVPETDPQAYALFLQANEYRQQSTADGTRQAEIYYQRALDIDPNYAPGWMGIGFNYFRQAAVSGQYSYDEGMRLARAAFQRALDLDPDAGTGQAGLAAVAMFHDWDFRSAEQLLETAHDRAPGTNWIVNLSARLQMTLGRIDEALELYRQARALDPLRGHNNMALALWAAGHDKEAADLISEGISLDPGRDRSLYMLSIVLLGQGYLETAYETVQDEQNEAYRLTGLAVIQYARGEIEAADAALNELIEYDAEGAAYQIAQCYALRGDSDAAFDWLERAYEVRDTGLVSILIDRQLASLRDDPRWTDLITRIGLSD